MQNFLEEMILDRNEKAREGTRNNHIKECSLCPKCYNSYRIFKKILSYSSDNTNVEEQNVGEKGRGRTRRRK